MALEPKVFDLLAYVVQNHERGVSKDDLIAAIWGRTHHLGLGANPASQCSPHCDQRQRSRAAPDQDVASQGRSLCWDDATARRPKPMITTGAGELSRTVFALGDKPTIAVLPFANVSSDPEQEYFADGITDDITTELSRFSELLVIARNSSFQYKGKSADVRQIGRELGVLYVLEGSLRRSGDRVRIGAQLVDTASGVHR